MERLSNKEEVVLLEDIRTLRTRQRHEINFGDALDPSSSSNDSFMWARSCLVINPTKAELWVMSKVQKTKSKAQQMSFSKLSPVCRSSMETRLGLLPKQLQGGLGKAKQLATPWRPEWLASRQAI